MKLDQCVGDVFIYSVAARTTEMIKSNYLWVLLVITLFDSSLELNELPVENSVIEHSMAEINGQTITVHI